MTSRTFSMLALAASLALAAAPAAAEQDANALANELSNPATSLASLGLKIEHRRYDGNLPGAEDQNGFTFTFQPVLPFILDSGDKIIFRPAFAFPINEPFFDGTTGAFDSGGGLGDIGFDLAYAPKTDGKFSYGIGAVGGIPAGTNSDLRSGNWTLGPEFFGAYIDDWGIIGGLATHSWKIAGHGNDTNLSSLQYFLFFNVGDGWQVGAGPTITYDWNGATGDRWNVPVGLGISKTTRLFGLPIKFNAEVDYSVVRQDTFGPEWLLKFNVTPVIANPFQ
ncbi:MAG: hypothetical protein AAGD13_00495 [Pseudomonadota bacterium]